MWVVTAEQMVQAERRTVAAGIPAAALMESAGRHVADTALGMLGRGGKVTILCGPGNNAGDGLVAARYLLNRGVRVTLLLTRPVDRLPEALQRLAAPLGAMGAALLEVEAAEAPPERLRALVRESDLVIDALLGTGARGAPRGAVRTAVLLCAEAPKVLAVDLPTGVDADTGRVADAAVRADVTVVMSAPKPGHLLWPGRGHCGELVVADVGIPQAYIAEVASARWVRPPDAGRLLPARPVDAHKGTFGKVLVVAGSYRMPGAAVLALRAALHSGAGLCSWAGPRSVLPIAAACAPEATFYPLAEADGALEPAAAEEALALSEGRAVAVGPGLGAGEPQAAFVAAFLSRLRSPVVVDADALTHLGRLGRWPGPEGSPAVLTPHPRELARLLGTTAEEVLADRMGAAREAAARYGAVVLAKGVPTLVATPGGDVSICPAGNPVLAVGGSGDVLTGLIAGLLAQGLPPAEAAVLGAMWHGAAADLLAAGGEDAGHTASELVGMLAKARARLLAQR